MSSLFNIGNNKDVMIMTIMSFVLLIARHALLTIKYFAYDV